MGEATGSSGENDGVPRPADTATDEAPVNAPKALRIVELPSAWVVASHYIGREPETNAGKAALEFVRNNRVREMKPDLRFFGFNHPNNRAGQPAPDGYEVWVTIPDDLDVSPPLMKKRFVGGPYAVLETAMGDWGQWDTLWKMIEQSPEYDFDLLKDGGNTMQGLLEEHLGIPWDGPADAPIARLNLMIPVKLRVQAAAREIEPGKAVPSAHNPFGVRVVRLPKTAMLSTAPGMFGDASFTAFAAFLTAQPSDLSPRDFLWSPAPGKFQWNYVFAPGVAAPAVEGLVAGTFPGGLYATALCRDGDGDDHGRVMAAIKAWAIRAGYWVGEENGRFFMGHMVAPDDTLGRLGYRQMDLFIPIRQP